ncbi:MAG: hypothetical protein Kow0010_17380 [Dehalococcoidia bacterium]
MGPSADLIVANRAYLDHHTPPGGGAEPPTGAGGLLEAVRPVIRAWDGERGTIWIGAGQGRYDRDWADERGYELIDTPHGPLRHRRLFIDPGIWDGHYRSAANAFLWPLLHQVRVSLPRATAYYPEPLLPSDAAWEAHRAVNRAFAAAVVEEQAARSAWVHDYQLGLAPSAIRERGYRGRIGFFLHTPFPDVAIAQDLLGERGMARLREFVQGILGADLAGFQTDGDARRFVSAAAFLCGARPAGSGLLHNGRLARVGVYPVGIDAEALVHVAHESELPPAVSGMLQGGLPLVAGLERADYTKGIPERLHAVARAIKEGERFAYAGIASPTRQGVAAYDRLEAEIARAAAVAEAAAREARLPFLHRQEALPWRQVVGILRRADVVFTSSLADGMNLVPLQAAMAQSLRPAAERGVLIAGRDAGVTSVFAGFEPDGLVSVDPLDADAMVAALKAALRGQPGRISQRLIDAVREHDARHWGARFLEDLHADA